MQKMVFKSYAVANEIDLNKIAIQCNIPKKYTWEEPLILKGDTLASILGRTVSQDEKIMVFSFGSVVFINLTSEDTDKFLLYLKEFQPDTDIKNKDRYSDDYELRFSGNEISLTDEYVSVPHFEDYYPELISTVIAKSVALEKTEEQISQILDTLESLIDRLEKGKFRIADKKIARTTSKILRHEYNTIAYIMILDKPDITWANSSAADFYDSMADFFELNDRYEILRRKSEILNNIMNGFSSISHSIRGIFVEWVIVILIIIEVALMVADLLK